MVLLLSTTIIIVVVPVMLGASGFFLYGVYLYRKPRGSRADSYLHIAKRRKRVVTSMDSDLESLVNIPSQEKEQNPKQEKRVTIQLPPPPLRPLPSAHLRPSPKAVDLSRRRKTLSTGPRARQTLADKMLEVQTLMWEIRKLQLLRRDEHEYADRIEELNQRLMVVIETGDESSSSSSRYYSHYSYDYKHSSHDASRRTSYASSIQSTIVQLQPQPQPQTASANTVLSPGSSRTARPVSRVPRLLPIYERYSEAGH